MIAGRRFTAGRAAASTRVDRAGVPRIDVRINLGRGTVGLCFAPHFAMKLAAVLAAAARELKPDIQAPAVEIEDPIDLGALFDAD